jgi:hypothetical protein
MYALAVRREQVIRYWYHSRLLYDSQMYVVARFLLCEFTVNSNI